MKKENHEFEVRASRALGFGGSDAAMVLAIGKKIAEDQPLTTTMKRRLRVIAGLDPIPEAVATEDMEMGHKYEDEVAKNFQGFPEAIRECKMEGGKEYRHFKVFAHADFLDTKTGTITECKWTRTLTFEQVRERYMAQLQWYYMLGASSVVLRCRVDVMGMCVDHKETIQEDKTITEALKWSLGKIDECWNVLDLRITEAEGNELPPEIVAAVRECKISKQSIEGMQRHYDEQAAIIREWMGMNGMSKISSGNASVTYTPAGSSSRFDSAGLKKAYPKIWEMFNKKGEKKEYITFKIQSNDNE